VKLWLIQRDTVDGYVVAAPDPETARRVLIAYLGEWQDEARLEYWTEDVTSCEEFVIDDEPPRVFGGFESIWTDDFQCEIEPVVPGGGS